MEHTLQNGGAKGSPKFKQKLLIAAVLLTTVTSQAAGYANSVVLPSKLNLFGAMDYYALFSAISGMGTMISLPLVGTLSRRYGVKMVTLFGIVSHFLVRLGLTAVPNLLIFAFGWVLMGFAKGLYMSAPYSIIVDIVPSSETPRYYGYISTASAVGALIGPAMTGIVVDLFSADAALLIYGVFGVFPVLVMAKLYPNHRSQRGEKFDFAGIVLVSLFVCCTVLWLSMVGKFFAPISLAGIGLPIVALGALGALIKIELAIPNPSVPIVMFRKKRFAVTFCVQMLMVAYSMCVTAYVVVYVQQVMGDSAFVSSTVTMPQTVVQGILGFFVGGIIGKNFKKRFRPAALTALSLYIAALLLLSSLRPDSSMLVIYAATAIGGISQAATQSIYVPFFQTDLKPEEIPAAQGMFLFSSTGGASIFGAICGAAMNLGASYNQIFLLAAAMVGIALMIAFFGFKFPQES